MASGRPQLMTKVGGAKATWAAITIASCSSSAAKARAAIPPLVRHVIVLDPRYEDADSVDWVYVNHFALPHKPLALELPAGRGTALREDMKTLVRDLRTMIRTMFESEEYATEVERIDGEFKQRAEQSFIEVGREAQRRGLAMVRTPVGFTVAPQKDGEVMPPQVFEKLPTKVQRWLSRPVYALRVVPGERTPYVEAPATLWTNGRSTYNGANDEIPQAEADRLPNSLVLIRVPALELKVFAPGADFGKPKRRVQALFTYRHVHHALWITDPVIEREFKAQPDGTYPLGECCLCVSLGEPFHKQNGESCRYKLVAAVMRREGIQP